MPGWELYCSITKFKVHANIYCPCLSINGQIKRITILVWTFIQVQDGLYPSQVHNIVKSIRLFVSGRCAVLSIEVQLQRSCLALTAARILIDSSNMGTRERKSPKFFPIMR